MTGWHLFIFAAGVFAGGYLGRRTAPLREANRNARLRRNAETLTFQRDALRTALERTDLALAWTVDERDAAARAVAELSRQLAVATRHPCSRHLRSGGGNN